MGFSLITTKSTKTFSQRTKSCGFFCELSVFLVVVFLGLYETILKFERLKKYTYMQNICFFNSTKFWGGGEKLHLEYAEKFQHKGYGVILACNKDGYLFPKGKEKNVNVGHVNAGNLSFINPLKVKQIKQFYLENNIDTVFFSTSQDAKLGGIAAKKAGVKNIIYLRGLAVPIKASVINKYLFNKVFTHFLVNSEETGRMMQKKFKNGFPKEKIKVIYHGIDIKEYDEQITTKLFSRNGDEILIGNAGRLTKQKGQYLFIDIAKHLKDAGVNFRILIAGTGDLEEELKTKIEENNLQKDIELLGFVSDIKSFMFGLDVFTLTSLWEGFGYVIVEAMAANKPVVAFDTSSNPEIIKNNKTGFLIKDIDTEEFASKLIELIQNKKLLSEMGKAARKSVEDRFNLDDRIDEIEEYLKDF